MEGLTHHPDHETNRNCEKQREYCVNKGPVQLALREWRTHFKRPETFVACAAIACILGVIGPFNTDEVMRLVPRIAYWAFLVIVPYSWGFLVDATIRAATGGQRPLLWVTVSALVTGLGVCLVVLISNYVFFAFLPAGESLAELILTVLVISTIVTMAFSYLGRRLRPEAEVASAPPPILARLPFDKRGALVALSVEDHYVRVQTVKGEEMLLMRLSDAIREVGDVDGAQVHRSHWAAFDQVAAVRREGDRAVLAMKTGQDIPVSRANLDKIRAAGLLPERK